jgi:hypothetical protein
MRRLDAAELWKDLGEAISAGQPVAGHGYIPQTKAKSDLNEFCVFIKPRIMRLPFPHLAQALDIVQKAFDDYDVNVEAQAILPGPVLQRHQIAAEHYGTISAVARAGVMQLPDSAAIAVGSMVKAAGASEVVGAYDFLTEVPGFTASSLAVLDDNLPRIRIAGGIFAVAVKAAGRKYIVLNAFYPAIEESFSDSSSAILVMACRTSTPWNVLRGRMIGATDPAKATPGSVRASFLNCRDEFGLREVSTLYNGIHISAGPIEGMIELSRLFSTVEKVPMAATWLGSILSKDLGFSSSELFSMKRNPVIVLQGRKGPLFDLTEELDTELVVALAGEELRTQL